MANALGMLNQIKQTFEADEAHLVTHFEVVKGVELQVSVHDGGVPAEPDRYFVSVLKDGAVVTEVGPEARLSDALRNVYSKARSLI